MTGDLFQNGENPPSTPGNSNLAPNTNAAIGSPLADRMRPATLDEVMGQGELLGPRGPLRSLITSGNLPSILLWGPPGCGKTTIARLIAHHAHANFLEFSAVAVGAKEVKAVMSEAEKLKRATGHRTILFLDEIHRFNKAQQDALLPWVERGAVTLIGATTENPSFEVNRALLSRTRLFVLKPLATEDIIALLERALLADCGLGGKLALTPEALEILGMLSEGDARAALGFLETVALVALAEGKDNTPLDAPDVQRILTHRAPRYDKGGEEHFNVISALHKSIRNSDVQASVYWLGRMLEGGEDPLYIARRLVRFASEDIGLADPEALTQALAARDAMQFLGRPEGDLALAQAVVYLALSPKSNALYLAHKAVVKEVASGPNQPVPPQLRNAPTAVMRKVGYGRGYVYAPNTRAGIAAMSCLPEALAEKVFYQPGSRGFEAELAQRVEKIRAWQQKHRRPHTEDEPDQNKPTTEVDHEKNRSAHRRG